jgi:hypothetical protein
MPRDGSNVYSKAAGTTAVAGQVIESAKYNSTIDDIVADLNLARPISAGGTGATTAAAAQTALGLLPGSFGFIYGLTLSNNGSDATNDIDIAVGTAASDAASPVLITLASAITKRLDAAWAVGTNQGGLDTGSIANTTYHVWLIQRSDTGVVDVLYSASATSPTMPANYDRKRLLGPIIRAAGVILPFRQFVDTWKLITPITVISGTAAYASLLTQMQGPVGVVYQPIFNVQFVTPAARNANVFAGDAAIGGINGVLLQAGAAASTEVNTAGTNVSSGFYTNTSGQLYTSLATTGSGAVTSFSIATIGWIFER